MINYKHIDYDDFDRDFIIIGICASLLLLVIIGLVFAIVYYSRSYEVQRVNDHELPDQQPVPLNMTSPSSASDSGPARCGIVNPIGADVAEGNESPVTSEQVTAEQACLPDVLDIEETISALSSTLESFSIEASQDFKTRQ